MASNTVGATSQSAALCSAFLNFTPPVAMNGTGKHNEIRPNMWHLRQAFCSYGPRDLPTLKHLGQNKDKISRTAKFVVCNIGI